jgi:hypothetical protein
VSGTPETAVRIDYRSSRVGELVVRGDADVALLEQIAALVSPYVLLGWDTGGEAWDT